MEKNLVELDPFGAVKEAFPARNRALHYNFNMRGYVLRHLKRKQYVGRRNRRGFEYISLCRRFVLLIRDQLELSPARCAQGNQRPDQ